MPAYRLRALPISNPQVDLDTDPFLDFGRRGLPTLPRKIYTHYVGGGCSRLRAAAVHSHQLRAGTRYTIRGVWGCSAPHQPDVDLYVSISIDGWEEHVVAGKDLL